MKPLFVTFTGADDMTPMSDLLSLSKQYPVEFAILFSRSRAGDHRYPSKLWTDQLKGLDLPLAAHICGAWATQIIETGSCDIEGRLGDFKRIQVNTSRPLDLDIIASWKAKLFKIYRRDFSVILQTRDNFPEDDRVEWLFDVSGGLGLSPKAWPQPQPRNAGVKIGYAGGLGPNNVSEALKRIDSKTPYWIDMETGVRNAYNHFDIKKCRKVCRIIW